MTPGIVLWSQTRIAASRRIQRRLAGARLHQTLGVLKNARDPLRRAGLIPPASAEAGAPPSATLRNSPDRVGTRSWQTNKDNSIVSDLNERGEVKWQQSNGALGSAAIGHSLATGAVEPFQVAPMTLLSMQREATRSTSTAVSTSIH